MWGSIAVSVVYAVVPTCCVLIGFGLIRRDYKPSEHAPTNSQPSDQPNDLLSRPSEKGGI